MPGVTTVSHSALPGASRRLRVTPTRSARPDWLKGRAVRPRPPGSRPLPTSIPPVGGARGGAWRVVRFGRWASGRLN